MGSLLKIKRTKGYSHVIWEHALLSVFAFTGMYGLLIFGPLLMGGKSRSRSHTDGNGLGAEIMIFLMENTAIVLVVCAMSVVVTNIYLLVKNTKNKYIVGIDVDNEQLTFIITDLYFKKVEKRTVSVNDVSFLLRTKFSEVAGKKQILKFFDKKNEKVIGFIKPNHVIWSDQVLDIRRALKELNSMGIEGSKIVGKDNTAMGNIFKS
jgi:hypothetical protein